MSRTEQQQEHLDLALLDMRARPAEIQPKMRQLVELAAIAASTLGEIRQALASGLRLVETHIAWVEGLAGEPEPEPTVPTPKGVPVN